jgi:hypothetical protein
MVDPRIYRACLVLVAFAVIVFGFSLTQQPSGLRTSMAPGAQFASAPLTMKRLAAKYPVRTPGSEGDAQLAQEIKTRFGRDSGFTVGTQFFTARTTSGDQTLENVVASRAGLEPGQVVVVSHRDSLGSPDEAGLAGTAVMLDMANALANETLGRTVTLISTSGQIGAAGAAQVARSLSSQQVDAVIVLGNLAGAQVRQPVVVPWSDTDLLAPPALRNTLSHYVASDAGIKTVATGIGGQVVRLAFPFTITEQAPFAGDGLSAVLLSLSGDRIGPANEPLAPSGRLTAMGSAALQAVNALDKGSAIASPSAYLLISGKVVPLWAVRLLVLALILPVAATMVDAVARTRRRGHSIMRWIVWVLAGAIPFLVGLGALLLARVTGLLSIVPAGAVGAGGVQLTGSGVAVLVGVGVLVVLSFVFLRPLCLRLLYGMLSERRPQSPAADAAAVALSVVMCVTSLVIWALDPFSALLLVPALHLWMWLSTPGVRSRRWAVLLIAVLAVLPAVAVIAYYGQLFGLSPLGLLWSGALLVAGGGMPIVTAVYWSVVLGCLASVLVIGVRSVRAAASAPEPSVTVRGPSSYAGPGSLGGTESAIRR